MLRYLSQRTTKELQFIDWRRVLVKAGNGGDGCAHLLRTAGNRKAGPDGGNGGVGGNVVLEADISIKQLRHVKKYSKAENGGNGQTKACHGKNGKHLIVKVPLGTTVKCNGEVIGDMKNHQEQFIVSNGGAGGYGNIYFKSSLNRRPLECTDGESGEEKVVELELKTIADIGLVGFPNAGKSTLLRAISNAKPAVAAYPFTTRNPYVGMVEFEDYLQVAVADIPGLIEGAHMNKGLGHSFLRHIERCRCLLYVTDISQDNPASHLRMLKKELDLYKTGLSSLPAAVVANKIDLLKDSTNLETQFKHIPLPFIAVSGKLGTNIANLKVFIRKLYEHGLNKYELFGET
ncbi:mitochondrial ribosome-associated GTPase 2-like [Dendronephthya gigantea]|uniref:mitochondrial ribosome-associated GTPase 2-like n=1 Tax=Dendronephthya gigantea TaxID=151771 RepID=UPI00106AA68C|nr:mitochondrial ribosome-associated GTPase 2-like [Dendronephthya gigantea]XP_028409974.1 mitochondrial ribosome-associated GTPase 2-like [Dendronephthya gigantea]